MSEMWDEVSLLGIGVPALGARIEHRTPSTGAAAKPPTSGASAPEALLLSALHQKIIVKSDQLDAARPCRSEAENFPPRASQCTDGGA
jgi:hypothetical protein